MCEFRSKKRNPTKTLENIYANFTQKVMFHLNKFCGPAINYS